MTEFIDFLIDQAPMAGAFVAILVTWLFMEVMHAKYGPKSLTPSHLVQLMNRHDVTVVDVRDQDSFGKGHIRGAKNITKSQIDSKMESLAKNIDKPLVVICEHGQQSSGISKKYIKQKFSEVYVLKGGITAWRQAGLPLNTR